MHPSAHGPNYCVEYLKDQSLGLHSSISILMICFMCTVITSVCNNADDTTPYACDADLQTRL